MIKRFFANPCNLYFSLWCLYLLQGTLYAKGSIISQGLLAVIIGMSLVHFYKVANSSWKPVYFKGLTALVIMYIIYGVALFMTDGSRTQGAWHPATYTYLKTYLISLLPIYSCYMYARKGGLNGKMLMMWCIVFVIVGIAQYYRMQQDALQELAGRGSSMEEVTNNAGYVMLSLIPCMMIFDKRPLWQYLGLGVCTVFVLMAMKRGAIIICAFSLLLFIGYKMRNSKGSRKFSVILITAIGMLFLFRYVQNFVETSDYFSARLEQTMEGNSSGRDRIYSSMLNTYFNDDNFFHLLFGRGANGTLKIYSNYAHQDWLEILINQGLFGIMIFACYWIFFWKAARSKSYSSTSRFTLLLIFCMFGLKTLFSMSIGDMTIYVSSILGYALADGFVRDEQLDL